MLNLQHYFIKERQQVLGYTDTYEILDPDTQQPVGGAREEVSTTIKFLRMFLDKNGLPTTVVVRNLQGEVVLRVRHPFTWLHDKVEVSDGQGQLIGSFQKKLLSLGGSFLVSDGSGKPFAEVKGDWARWNYRFATPDGVELGTVAEKYPGFAQALITDAHSYYVSVNERLKDQPVAKLLLLGATLAIDIIYKERE